VSTSAAARRAEGAEGTGVGRSTGGRAAAAGRSGAATTARFCTRARARAPRTPRAAGALAQAAFELSCLSRPIRLVPSLIRRPRPLFRPASVLVFLVSFRSSSPSKRPSSLVRQVPASSLAPSAPLRPIRTNAPPSPFRSPSGPTPSAGFAWRTASASHVVLFETQQGQAQ